MELTTAQQKTIARGIKILEDAANYSEHIFTDPKAVKDYARLRLGMLEHEEFHVMYLDNKHRLIKCVMESKGTIDGAAVYPREILKSALNHNAAAVILAHNHPSGDTTPSHADKAITKKLVEVLALVDIRVLDHVIVSKKDCFAFAEQGLL